MFSNQHFITMQVSRKVPILLQVLLWSYIDSLTVPKDYLQVFELKRQQGKQKILHKQEVPKYFKEYLIESECLLVAKIFVIDDGVCSTMLFAEEY